MIAKPRCNLHPVDEGAYYCPQEEVFFCLTCDENEVHEGHYEGRRAPRAEKFQDKWPSPTPMKSTSGGDDDVDMINKDEESSKQYEQIIGLQGQADRQIEKLERCHLNINLIETFNKAYGEKVTFAFQQVLEKIEELAREMVKPVDIFSDNIFVQNPGKIQEGVDRWKNYKAATNGWAYSIRADNNPKHLNQAYAEFIKVQNEVGNPGILADNDLSNVSVTINIDVIKEMVRNQVRIEPNFKKDLVQRLHYFNEESKEIYIYEVQEEKGECKQFDVTAIPCKFNSIMLENEVYIIGGEERSETSNWNFVKSIFLYNYSTGELSKVCDMLTERSGHQLAYANVNGSHRIYIVGTMWPDEDAKKCEYYDIRARACFAVPANLNYPRHSLGLTCLNNRFLYAIGGRGPESTEILGSIERLDLLESGGKWMNVELRSTDSLWTSKYMHGACAISKNDILIFGGDFGWDSTTFLLKTNNNEIEKLEKAVMDEKTAEYGCQNVVVDKRWLYTVNLYDKKVLKYSIDHQKWMCLPKWVTDWEKSK